jgi:hypothetical protein
MQSTMRRVAAAEAELRAAEDQEQRFWSEVVPELSRATDMEKQRRLKAEAKVCVVSRVLWFDDNDSSCSVAYVSYSKGEQIESCQSISVTSDAK